MKITRRPFGTPKVRPDGYTRRTIDGVRRLTHVWVWLIYHGKIPKGYEVHHKNKKRWDNRLENLELLLKKDHVVKHRNYKIIAGILLKFCPTCSHWKNRETQFYKKNKRIYEFQCKQCHCKLTTKNKQKRRAL